MPIKIDKEGKGANEDMAHPVVRIYQKRENLYKLVLRNLIREECKIIMIYNLRF